MSHVGELYKGGRLAYRDFKDRDRGWLKVEMDVILSGTPAGVGMGEKPPKDLKPGDEMRLGIDGLGEQIQICVSA